MKGSIVDVCSIVSVFDSNQAINLLKSSNTALIYAAKGGHTITCASLLLGGSDVDHANDVGLTPYLAAGEFCRSFFVIRPPANN
jgi:hypothetical protein